MRVKDILTEVREVTGSCEDAVNFRTISRAAQILARKGLFDPLIGYLDFTIDGGYHLALPRDVKSPIRLNINNSPAFSRSRIFEFTMNTEGSVEEEEVGFSWSDRGTAPIQNESPLPSVLKALATDAADNGKQVKVTGKDGEGIVRTEILTISTDPPEGEITFHQITSVIKDRTVGEIYLQGGDLSIARYYPDEEEPQYRIIKLSKTGVAVRLMYRKHVFKLESEDDIIPLDDEIGLIWMCKAVRKRIDGHYDEANELEKQAVQSITEEQASRNEHVQVAKDTESQTAIDTNINTIDGLIVADVYDEASSIFGPVGRQKLFDKISTAAELLENKSQWESQIGHVDIWKPDHCDTIPDSRGCQGNGYFVLPRFIDVPLAVNICGNPHMARNRWFEFHLNGPGESDRAFCGTWYDLGEVNTINFLPLDRTTRQVIPHKLVAICEDSLDEGTSIVVTGWDANGKRIFDGDQEGFTVPCTTNQYIANPRVPAIARIDRITKAKSRGYIRLYAVRSDTTNIALVGDMGFVDETTDLVEAMIKEQDVSDLILIGDNNYPGGHAETIDATLGAHWRKFIFPFLGDSDLAPLKTGERDATENHLWAIPGNHDYDNTTNPDKLQPYLDYLTLPGNERYYSKVFGEVEVFFLNSELAEPDGITVGSVQHQWFLAQLQASTATWKVVVFHRHVFSSGDRHSENAAMLAWNFQSLGVHAVIGAHDHNYERLLIDDMLAFVVGTGGPDLNGFVEPPDSRSEFRMKTNGALFMYGSPGALTFSFRDVNGNELDTATLTNDTAAREPILMGYYYPDEVEPKYRLLKLPTCKEKRVRIRYRKRSKRVTSLFEPLHLRSRYAIENMMRSMKANADGSVKNALEYEAVAVAAISDEQSAKNPVATGGFQFDASIMPGVTDNFT